MTRNLGGPLLMTRHLPSLLIAPCLGCLISLACAAPPDETASPGAAPAAKKGNSTSYASLVKDRSGRPVLMINYRWKLYPATSVEVRLAAPDEAPAKVVPLYFVREYFQGDVSRKVFHCLDEAEQRETVESFLKDNMDLQIVGRRNSLGRPAVLVAPRDKVSKRPARARLRPQSQGRVSVARLLVAGRSHAQPGLAAGEFCRRRPSARLVHAIRSRPVGRNAPLAGRWKEGGRRRGEGGRRRQEGQRQVALTAIITTPAGERPAFAATNRRLGNVTQRNLARQGAKARSRKGRRDDWRIDGALGQSDPPLLRLRASATLPLCASPSGG